ncbi:MAG: 23S rRNA (pseudouridine(1915)-N(3))-methyltransferase RlmH [candidate division Zixibacteria bacterium]
MLKIHIITVGRDKDSWVNDAIDHYSKLIKKYARLEFSIIAEDKYNSSTDILKAKIREGERIISRLKNGFIIVLDLKGQVLNTMELAEKISQWQNQSISTLEFIIGGPFGLSDDILRKADYILNMSSLTMSHQIIRLVLLEQLYRVLNINAGGSYHK